jgi:tetratricopeptide (TPR) repeat protein
MCMAGKDFGPPAAPLLAVRAARRAVLESSNSASAYFRLATAYRALWQEQEDVWLGMRLASSGQTPRQQMRHVQTVSAIEQGLRLRPTDAQGHETLGNLYYQAGYNDLALEHFQESLKYAVRNPGESMDEFKKRIETVQQILKGLEDDVRRQKNLFELESANKPAIQKAQLALYKCKLARRAIEVLQGSAELDPQIVDMAITLHLSTGGGTLEKGLSDVRDSLHDVSRSVGPNYERYMLLLEAATGNYAEAGKYLDETIQRLENETHMRVLATVRNQALGGAGALQQNNVIIQGLQNVFLIADYKVLRGILALEAGDTSKAARQFEEATKVNNQQAFDFESKPIGDRYLELIKAAGGAK